MCGEAAIADEPVVEEKAEADPRPKDDGHAREQDRSHGASQSRAASQTRGRGNQFDGDRIAARDPIATRRNRESLVSNHQFGVATLRRPLDPSVGVRLVAVHPPHVHEDLVESAIEDRRRRSQWRFSVRCRRRSASTLTTRTWCADVHLPDGPRLALLEVLAPAAAFSSLRSVGTGVRGGTTRGCLRPVDGNRESAIAPSQTTPPTIASSRPMTFNCRL